MRIFQLLMLVALVSGCENIELGKNGRYSGDKDKKGDFIVLDTRSGEVAILQNGQLVQIPTEESTGIVKDFRNQSLSGYPVIFSDLSIKFRNGRLLYRGLVKYFGEKESESSETEISAPSSIYSDDAKKQAEIVDKIFGLWEGSSKQVTMLLTDSDGFNVTSFGIREKNLFRVVDEEGNAKHLSFEGESSITPKDYEAISDYTFSWKLKRWQE